MIIFLIFKLKKNLETLGRPDIFASVCFPMVAQSGVGAGRSGFKVGLVLQRKGPPRNSSNWL